MNTRESLESSWRVARARADANGALILNAASVAGHLLQTAHGDPVAALVHAHGDTPFWARVRSYLTSVQVEGEVHQVARKGVG